MDLMDRSCQCDCTGRAVAASVIIGIIAAFLRFNATITVTPAFLWVVLGVAVVYLGIVLLTTRDLDAEYTRCTCRTLSALLTGVLGTILFAVILLGITFAATSVIGAIITGVLLFFFSFLLISTVCFIRCRYNCN